VSLFFMLFHVGGVRSRGGLRNICNVTDNIWNIMKIGPSTAYNIRFCLNWQVSYVLFTRFGCFCIRSFDFESRLNWKLRGGI